jgi:hypothetical protein
MTVPQSKDFIMETFKITESQLNGIIDEGNEKDWPPLNEPMQKAG